MIVTRFQVKRDNGTVSGEFHTVNRALWFCSLMNHSHVDDIQVEQTGGYYGKQSGVTDNN